MEYVKLGYHGTSFACGRQILTDGKFIPSQRLDEWLGDGTYFFLKELDAYIWIRDKLWKIQAKRNGSINARCPFLNYRQLPNFYCILKATICTQEERIFQMNDLDHKMDFDNIWKYMENGRILQDPLLPKIVEPSVLNYMFGFLNFQEDYDAVLGQFPCKKRKYDSKITRFSYLPQWQLCVKNPDIIKKIESFPLRENLPRLEQRYQEYIGNIYRTE